MSKEEQVKCQKCGSTDVKINRHHNDEAEEGSIESVDCNVCGHHEPYYSTTKRGEEILKILLP